MIRLIKGEVKMPKSIKRRFQYGIINDKWVVKDTIQNKEIYKGSYEDAAIRCYNLNKKYYRDLNL